uniref:Uncharacterized protein n=1 Tax=Tetranychus urticae TaxID=32264 RepID=T1KD22_TETUR
MKISLVTLCLALTAFSAFNAVEANTYLGY